MNSYATTSLRLREKMSGASRERAWMWRDWRELCRRLDGGLV